MEIPIENSMSQYIRYINQSFSESNKSQNNLIILDQEQQKKLLNYLNNNNKIKLNQYNNILNENGPEQKFIPPYSQIQQNYQKSSTIESAYLIEKQIALKKDLSKDIENVEQFEPATQNPVSPPASLNLKYSLLIFAIILLLKISSQIQRQIIGYAYGFQGAGEQLSNPQYQISVAYPQLETYYGLLSGAAFALTYSISGIFAGQFSDQYSRKILLGITAVLWSTTCIASGSINNFYIFFIMRFLLGSLQSAINPTSFSLMQDYFPAQYRSTIYSIFNSGSLLGSAISSFSIMSIMKFGWKSTYNFMGLIGIILGSLVLLFVKEPVRIQTQIKQQEEIQIQKQNNVFANFKNSLIELMKNKTSRYTTIAGMFYYFGGYACMYYMPAFYQKVYPSFINEFAFINALSLFVFGFISNVAGGIVSDRFSKNNQSILSQICIFSSVTALPFALSAFLITKNFYLSIICLALKYLLGETWLSPCQTMIQNTIKKEKSGSQIAAFYFFITLSGTISTALFGILSNYFNAISNPIVYGKILASFEFFSFFGSIPFLWKAGSEYKKQMKQNQEREIEELYNKLSQSN